MPTTTSLSSKRHSGASDSVLINIHKKVNRPSIAFLFNQDPAAYLKRQREENDKIWHKTKRICAGPGVSPASVALRSETLDRSNKDKDYNSLPDYAPPTSTGNLKIPKIDWQSDNALNLSNDPDRHMLHEAEIYLASRLRLSCATYICSKRRIFIARLNALKIGKEFRKTDAQQACKIDVNKASKLWVVFDKVGWFT